MCGSAAGSGPKRCRRTAMSGNWPAASNASKREKGDTDRERFFRIVDRVVLEHHSRPAGVPLLLAALPEHHHPFRRITRNGFLLDDSLDVHPDALSPADLRERAWRAIEPHYLIRLDGLVEM